MEIKTTARNRKDVVNAIREFTGEDSVYLGPPTFAYQVGNFMIDRDGTVTVEEEAQGLTECRGWLSFFWKKESFNGRFP